MSSSICLWWPLRTLLILADAMSDGKEKFIDASPSSSFSTTTFCKCKKDLQKTHECCASAFCFDCLSLLVRMCSRCMTMHYWWNFIIIIAYTTLFCWAVSLNQIILQYNWWQLLRKYSRWVKEVLDFTIYKDRTPMNSVSDKINGRRILDKPLMHSERWHLAYCWFHL